MPTTAPRVTALGLLMLLVMAILGFGSAAGSDSQERDTACGEECLPFERLGDDPVLELADMDYAASEICALQPVKRVHSVHGAVDALRASCTNPNDLVETHPELVSQAQSASGAGSCYVPTPGNANRYSHIWLTAYYDDGITPGEAHNHMAYAYAYLNKKTNGAANGHNYRADVNWCLNYLMEVPSTISGADVGSETELVALRDHEAGFDDNGQVTIVIGDGKIRVDGEKRYGVTAPRTSGIDNQDDLPAVWIKFTGMSNPAASRLLVHEMGHAMTLGHSRCDTGFQPSSHKWLHFMAWSEDAHSTCWDDYPTDPKLSHLHWEFQYDDNINIHYAADAWCADYNGGVC